EQYGVDTADIQSAVAYAGLRVQSRNRQRGGDLVRDAFDAILVEPHRDQHGGEQQREGEDAGHQCMCLVFHMRLSIGFPLYCSFNFSSFLQFPCPYSSGIASIARSPRSPRKKVSMNG